MISNAQIRAARALLGLGIDELSAASGVSASTIREIEATDSSRFDGMEAVAMKTALDRLGVAFLSPGDCCDGGEGLRLKARQETREGIRPENLNATNDD